MPSGEFWIGAKAINDEKMLGLAADEMKNLAFEASYNIRDVLVTVHHHETCGLYILTGSAVVPKDVSIDAPLSLDEVETMVKSIIPTMSKADT